MVIVEELYVYMDHASGNDLYVWIRARSKSGLDLVLFGSARDAATPENIARKIHRLP